MIYLSRIMGKPVVDASGDQIGTISDIAISTGEIFPRVTSLAFLGPGKTPFMLSWRKYVEEFDGERVTLNAKADALRFSYLQPNEVLLYRDLLNKQIVDTQGMKVVRVNDLKLAESRTQLRLLGADVGIRGLLRGMAPWLESAVAGVSRLFGDELSENLIAWNYMDLLDRDLSRVKLSVTHKRLHELHPADVADVLEQLNANQRGKVFEHLDDVQAAEAISEMEDELQAEALEGLTSQRASDILEMMDPDDAADIIGDLPYTEAEKLLRLMGLKEQKAIRALLGYKDKTAGGIMTSEVTTVTEDMTVTEVIDHLRGEARENESIYYIYVVDGKCTLIGVISLRDLILAQPGTKVAAITERDVVTVDVEEDQERVADLMSKYDLLALPVVDETGCILGMVTVDDALDVMEQESAEDLALATGTLGRFGMVGLWQWVSRNGWLAFWAGLFLGASIAAHFSPALGSLLLLGLLLSTVVMRVAEDVASHAMARVIEREDEEDRPPRWRLLLDDGLAGLGLAVLIGLAAFGLLEIWGTTPSGLTVLFRDALLPFPAWIGLALGVSVLVVTVTGTLLGFAAENADAKGRRVSQFTVTGLLVVAGAVVFLAVLAPVVLHSSVIQGPLWVVPRG